MSNIDKQARKEAIINRLVCSFEPGSITDTQVNVLSDTVDLINDLFSGAENTESRCGNSLVIPDGWVACSERMPDNGGESRRLYLCWGTYHDGDEPGHIPAWLFIHPTYGWYEWQPVEDDCNPKSVVITHWMSLPAAPQQDEASSNVIDTYRGSDGKPTVIPDAYEIKSFGFFSAAVGDDDLILQIEKFSFDSGGISQPEIDDFVPRLALQAIINKLQEHCDRLGNRPLDNVLSGLGREE